MSKGISNNMMILIVIILILLALLASFLLFRTGAPGALAGGLFSFDISGGEVAPIDPTKDCTDYDFNVEYTQYFGYTNIQIGQAACEAAGGVWTLTYNQFSCHLPSTVSFDCTETVYSDIERLCDWMQGYYICDPTTAHVFGCFCEISPPTKPLGEEDEIPDEDDQLPEYSCGWIISDQICHGTCPPTHPSCAAIEWYTGDKACACLDLAGNVHPDWKQDGQYYDPHVPGENGEIVCVDTDPPTPTNDAGDIHVFGTCTPIGGVAEPDICPTDSAVTQLFCSNDGLTCLGLSTPCPPGEMCLGGVCVVDTGLEDWCNFQGPYEHSFGGLTSDECVQLAYDTCIATDETYSWIYNDDEGYCCFDCIPYPGAVGTIFVTDLTWNGASGGVAGINAKCQNQAYYAGFAGTWIAIIGDTSANARTRVSIDGPFYRVDGVIIADNHADLFDGSIQNPININQYWGTETGTAWTGSDGAGYYVSDNCHEWGWESADGYYGDISSTGYSWLHSASVECSAGKHFYCVRVS